MAREQYVHPPLVATEPPSPVVVLWRFRAVAAVLTLVALAVIAYLFLSFSGLGGGEDPGLNGLRLPTGL